MMKLRNLIFGLLVCLSLLTITVLAQKKLNSSGAQTGSKAERVEKEILRLEEFGRQKALRGDTNWDDLMAESAYLIQADGSVLIYRKGQNLSSMPLKSFKLSELVVRVYADSAVATGLSEVTSETREKKPFSF